MIQAQKFWYFLQSLSSCEPATCIHWLCQAHNRTLCTGVVISCRWRGVGSWINVCSAAGSSSSPWQFLTFLRHAGLLFVSLRGKFHDPAEKLCRSWAEKGDWKWHKYSSTWCLVRDRHHLFNGSISIYGYLQRNQTIENASLPAALMGKIKGHPNFFFFPERLPS